MMFGAGPEPDANQSALLRNLKDNEDQYATAVTFQIRASAREGTPVERVMDQLTPDQRTRCAKLVCGRPAAVPTSLFQALLAASCRA
jgi:hypothetical protein